MWVGLRDVGGGYEMWVGVTRCGWGLQDVVGGYEMWVGLQNVGGG